MRRSFFHVRNVFTGEYVAVNLSHTEAHQEIKARPMEVAYLTVDCGPELVAIYESQEAA